MNWRWMGTGVSPGLQSRVCLSKAGQVGSTPTHLRQKIPWKMQGIFWLVPYNAKQSYSSRLTEWPFLTSPHLVESLHPISYHFTAAASRIP